MEIKEGYNSKPTTIRVYSQENGSIEMWIEQTGLEGSKDTLSYLTPDELLTLFREVKSAGKNLFD